MSTWKTGDNGSKYERSEQIIWENIKSKWKKIAVIGSTGNLGRQTLKILMRTGLTDNVVLLSGGKNFSMLLNEAKTFKKAKLHLFDQTSAQKAENMTDLKIYKGWEELSLLLDDLKPDLVFVEIAGIESLKVTLKSLETSKRVALASKEAMVVGGKFVMNKYESEDDVELIPVDSEHSAIFQLIRDEEKSNIDRIVLTASGGALRDWELEKMKNAKVKDVLKHPVWNMGTKITVDSATMVNKIMEIVEAHHFFNIPFDRIDVLINKEGLIHSMVKFIDGIWKIHFGFPSMEIPIAYSLTFPYRSSMKILNTEEVNPKNLLKISLVDVDKRRYPIFDLLEYMIKNTSSAFITFNAANEIAVQSFLESKIPFIAISEIISRVVYKVKHFEPRSLDDVYEIDKIGRKMALEEVKRWE